MVMKHGPLFDVLSWSGRGDLLESDLARGRLGTPQDVTELVV